MLGTLERVDHGADETAELWRGVTADESAYAIKLSGGGTPAGLVVSAHLAEQGITGVARPVHTVDGALWSTRGGRRLSVVPWVSDQRALSKGMGAGHWRSYGALLAAIHRTPVTDALAAVLPREEHNHQEVASVARTLAASLPELAAAPDPLLAVLATEWAAAAGRIATLVEQADALGATLRRQAARHVICHADPHLGNVLFGGDDRVWLVDWDDAVLAPRERDLMFVIGGVLAFAPVTRQEQAWFFEGYGPVDIDPVRLAYHQCVRALEDSGFPAAQVAGTGEWTDPERADALEILQGVLSEPGLVNLALAFVARARSDQLSSGS